MKYRVQISKLAANDIQKAIRWYEGVKKGLGRKFYSAVDSSLQGLKQFPLFEIRYDDVRVLLVKGFPYAIHFTVDQGNGVVLVKGVFHTSLDPNSNWKNDRRDAKDG